MNKVTLIGRLGHSPEVKYTPNGLCVTNLSLATNERYTKDGQKVQETEWPSLVAFGRTTEICGEYLSNGSHIEVEGKLKTNSWEAQDGTKRFKTQVIIGIPWKCWEIVSKGVRQDIRQAKIQAAAGRPMAGRGHTKALKIKI